MGKGKIIAGTLAGLIMAGGIAGGIVMAVPKTRNAIMDGIAKNSTIYKSAMENNSKLEQDYKSKSDRVSELETIQANLKLEIEKVKNDAKLNDEEKSAKIADLQKQIADLNERIQIAEGINDASIHTESRQYLRLVDSSNNYIAYFTKYVEDGVDVYDDENISGTDLAKLADVHFGGIHTDDSYYLKVPSIADAKFSSSGHHFFEKSAITQVPTTYNVEIVDENNNAFDFADVNPDLTYKLTTQRFEYTCYSVDELVDTNYKDQTNILKTVDVKVVVSVA